LKLAACSFRAGAPGPEFLGIDPFPFPEFILVFSVRFFFAVQGFKYITLNAHYF
jgi:hypothetical protein